MWGKPLAICSVLALTVSVALAQPGAYPPNAEPGKCYARCYIPDEYGWVEETVIDQPARKEVVVVPAVYKTVYDTIIVKPAQKKLEVVPPEWETIVERVMVEPPHTEWVKGAVDPNCLSGNPEDCQVLCLVEVPAKFKDIKRRVMKSPGYTKEINIPAVTKVVERKVLVKPETTKEINIPPTYKTVLKRVVKKAGGFTEWREVLCEDDLTANRIMEIQLALLKAGYDPGPIDNILGEKTKEALRQFQIDHNLPVGNLNIETLKALGIELEN